MLKLGKDRVAPEALPIQANASVPTVRSRARQSGTIFSRAVAATTRYEAFQGDSERMARLSQANVSLIADASADHSNNPISISSGSDGRSLHEDPSDVDARPREAPVEPIVASSSKVTAPQLIGIHKRAKDSRKSSKRNRPSQSSRSDRRKRAEDLDNLTVSKSMV